VGTGSRRAVLVQYRTVRTEQMHRMPAHDVRIEQTRRRLATLRQEQLVERITLPQAGRLRAWFPTEYGAHAMERPELRGRRMPRLISDPTAARLQVAHTLAVTETALTFLEDARRRGETCQPWTGFPRSTTPSVVAWPSSPTPCRTTGPITASARA
jgi:hypothetical protein